MNRQSLNRRMPKKPNIPTKKGKRKPGAQMFSQGTKCEYKGIQFDSLTEMEYYKYLERDNTVERIRTHPQYTIIDPYKVICRKCNGKGTKLNEKTLNLNKCTLCKGMGRRTKAGAVYTADFIVTYTDGYTEVIDVKGKMINRDFPLRRKLAEKMLGVEIVVVTKENGIWVRS